MKVKKWITNNFGLKILCLFLAIATWFYVNRVFAKIKSDEEKAIISMLQYDVISKKLPVQLTIVGKAREGYELITEAIAVEPETIVVVGPENILDEVNYVRTVPIDIAQYTEDAIEQVELAPIARGIVLKDELITVHIPIKKANEAD